MSRLVTIGSVWLRPNADSSSGSINSSRLLAFRTRGHTDNDLQPSPPHIVKFVRVPTAFRSAQLSSPKDVPILIGGHDRSAEGRERGSGHEERAATLSLPSRGSRERLSSPNVESPTAQRFSTIFSTQDGLSWHYNIVNCGLSCTHWGQYPRAPHAAYTLPLSRHFNQSYFR